MDQQQNEDMGMAPKKAGGRTSYLQPNREGRKSLVVWIDGELHRDLKVAAAMGDTTIQEIVASAIEVEVAKRKKAQRNQGDA